MKYRNRSARCSHGFARDLVKCPTCDHGIYDHSAYASNVTDLFPNHHVVSKRPLGRERGRKHHGYGHTVGRARR